MNTNELRRRPDLPPIPPSPSPPPPLIPHFPCLAYFFPSSLTPSLGLPTSSPPPPPHSLPSLSFPLLHPHLTSPTYPPLPPSLSPCIPTSFFPSLTLPSPSFPSSFLPPSSPPDYPFPPLPPTSTSPANASRKSPSHPHSTCLTNFFPSSPSLSLSPYNTNSCLQEMTRHLSSPLG